MSSWMKMASLRSSESGDRWARASLVQLLVSVLAARILWTVLRRYLQYRADMAFGKSHGCQPPAELVKRWPLGLDRLKQIWTANANNRLLAFFLSISDEYEPANCIGQTLLFDRGYYLLDPENVDAVLSTKFKDFGFGDRPGVFAPLLGKGIFTQEGAAWKHSRELLRKQFARTQYQKLDQFREHVDNLLQNLPQNGVVDLQPLFFGLTLDTATALLFGRSVYSLRANIDQNARNKHFSDSFSLGQEGLAKRFRLGPLHWLYNPKAFQKACADVHAFVGQYVDEIDLGNESIAGQKAYGFINQVAQESTDRRELSDQLLNVLLAGRDTTACCLSWTFRLLVRHPSVLDRLRKEIADTVGNSEDITREQVRRMPFLAHVVKESLRLYPSVPVNARQALETVALPVGGGLDGKSPVLVRKGENVMFSPYVTGRKTSIWGSDAREFRPERWETGELSHASSAFFPFNSGPRQCLGEDFALMEVYYTVVRLFQTCPVIRLPDNEKVEPIGSEPQTLTLVIASADGCKVDVRQHA